MKYRLLNIFYNRENEIKFLEELQSEELNVINNKKSIKNGVKKQKRNLTSIDIN
ncbi:Mobile element protein [Methanosarcina siciliae HI350]|uniref:Mobile element protein n=1 Tax=Methanosarcina siciliae HI350 TaxID=1434119 RepID=A0A0E3PCL9_9EURY|nr:Mobile element protein [Methanosarcina siciliae HI350]